MKILITSLFILLFLEACADDYADPSILKEPERLVFSGAGELGIFDPSLDRDPETGYLWMSYSSVEASTYYDASVYWAVSIRLAYSDDNGVNWYDAGIVAAPYNENIIGPVTEDHPDADIPAGSQGIWQSETSSLVYDPSAPPAERWKLIWHQYLNAGLTSFFADYSWIALKMAATPMELAGAAAVKLFGGAGLQADNTVTGSPVFAPIGGAPQIMLNKDLTGSAAGVDLAELNYCIFAEPGLYATSTAVYLAIYCADASSIPVDGNITEYLVYFRCGSPCNMSNAGNWEYLGRLLSPADAQAATGHHHFQAPALVEKNAHTYLLVTPVDTTTGERYDGCRVYRLDSVESNRLVTDENGLVEMAGIVASSHNGACGAYAGMDGGILISQSGEPGTADAFMIFKSQVSLP